MEVVWSPLSFQIPTRQWTDQVDPDISHATRQLVRLLRTLGELGFQTEVRHGDKSSLLVFVRAPEESLHRAVHTSRYVQTSGHSSWIPPFGPERKIGHDRLICDLWGRVRVRDWLYGLRNTEPDPAGSQEPKTDAERLRAIYYMITSPREYGGAGITPKHGDWKHVESIFALHDQRTNGKWIMKWSKETLLDRDELDQIRAKFGEKVRDSAWYAARKWTFLLTAGGGRSDSTLRSYSHTCAF